MVLFKDISEQTFYAIKDIKVEFCFNGYSLTGFISVSENTCDKLSV